MVGRYFELHKAASPEINFFPFRQPEHQFLDESGNIVVGNHFALPAFYLEKFGGDLDLKILLDGCLAAQAPAFSGLAPGKVAFLCREHGTATFENPAAALTTCAATTTGRRQENACIGKSIKQFSSCLYRQCLFRVGININGHQTRADQLFSGEQNDKHQHHNDAREHAYPQKNLVTHRKVLLRIAQREMPPKDINPRDINPTVINVMPRP